MKERKTPWQCDSVGTVTLPPPEEKPIRVDHVNLTIVNGVVHIHGSLDKQKMINLFMAIAVDLELDT